MWVTLSMIRSREGEYTDGLGSSRMYTRGSSSQGREMVEELFGGQMAAGIKASLRTVYNADRARYIVKEAQGNTRASGRTACSTARAHSTLTTVNATKVTSKKINSMATASSTKTTRSSTACGRIINYQLSIWLSLFSGKSDLLSCSDYCLID